MIEGRIKSIDVAQRRAVITTRAGDDVAVTFPADAMIEVPEPETMGTMGGELTDLRQGYFVEIEVAAHGADGSCTCASLLCVS